MRASISSATPPLATAVLPGLMAASDKAMADNARKAYVNVLDFGADATGATDSASAFASAIAALPTGGWIIIPAGTFLLASAVTVNKPGIKFVGTSRNNSIVRSNSATADIFVVSENYAAFENFCITTTVTRTAGYAINASALFASLSIRQMLVTGASSTPLYNGINASNNLSDIDDVEVRFFSNYGVYYTGNTDHRISRTVMDNASQAQAGIRVEQCASLVGHSCDIMRSGQMLDLSPSSTNQILNVKFADTFFEVGLNGIRLNPGSGFIYRALFINCFCNGHSGSGVSFAGANCDGITIENCDLVNSACGVRTDTAPAGDWALISSRVAGNSTAGVSLSGGTSHFAQVLGCDIGPQGGYGVNATGIVVAAGTYKGLRIESSKILGNTTNLSLGTVTVATGDAPNYAMLGCPGINPRGSVTTPAVPSSTVPVTNSTGFRCMAYLKGGTITQITVSGAPTGLAASTPILLEPGATIAVTYTVAFTWTWVAS